MRQLLEGSPRPHHLAGLAGKGAARAGGGKSATGCSCAAGGNEVVGGCVEAGRGACHAGRIGGDGSCTDDAVADCPARHARSCNSPIYFLSILYAHTMLEVYCRYNGREALLTLHQEDMMRAVEGESGNEQAAKEVGAGESHEYATC